jgi:hypothetical protein
MTEVIDLADTYEGAEARLMHLTEQASTGREHLVERLTQGQTRLGSARNNTASRSGARGDPGTPAARNPGAPGRRLP